MHPNHTPMVHVRSFTLQTLTGHSVTFKGPNEPVGVPPEAVQECMAAGAGVVETDKLPDNSGVEKTIREKAEEEPRGIHRVEAIKVAMNAMVAENDADAFDANGNPKVPEVSRRLGFKIDRNERDAVWKEVKAKS